MPIVFASDNKETQIRVPTWLLVVGLTCAFVFTMMASMSQWIQRTLLPQYELEVLIAVTLSLIGAAYSVGFLLWASVVAHFNLAKK